MRHFWLPADFLKLPSMYCFCTVRDCQKIAEVPPLQIPSFKSFENRTDCALKQFDLWSLRLQWGVQLSMLDCDFIVWYSQSAHFLALLVAPPWCMETRCDTLCQDNWRWHWAGALLQFEPRCDRGLCVTQIVNPCLWWLEAKDGNIQSTDMLCTFVLACFNMVFDQTFVALRWTC